MYLPLNAQKFPVVSDFATFRGLVGEKDEIRHMEQDNGFTVSCYMISGESTFDNLYARECRGIVFSPDGKVAARPLTKFHNLNECAGWRAEDFDWSKVVRVMDKRDGSMIHTVSVPVHLSPFNSKWLNSTLQSATFDVKSKKSFKSDVAVAARSWLNEREDYIDFCQAVTEAGLTAIFEYTSPTARIVLAYPQDELQLLHIRDNVTGRYLMQSELKVWADEYGVTVVKPTETAQRISDTLDGSNIAGLLAQLAEETEGVEGWVIQFADGEMVKVKTKWYLSRHKTMTFLRERDIVGSVLNESLDDLKSMLVGEGVDIAELNEIEQRVVKELGAVAASVEMTYAADKHLERKDFALKYQGKHQYFGLLMTRYGGKEPDVKQWYERNVLPTVSLRQLNLMNSVAEAE